jgi:hypothetical protein
MGEHIAYRLLLGLPVDMEHFQEKWEPVFRLKMRQAKNPA